MARIVDPVTGGLSFECREDLSPEFDIAKPVGLRWDFELPRDVDLFVAISRHRTESDFAATDAYMDGADLLLAEGVGEASEAKQPIFEELSLGDRAVLQAYLGDIAKGGFVDDRLKGFECSKARSVCAHRVAYRLLDPPSTHIDSVASELIATKQVVIADGRMIEALNIFGLRRDIWCLNNLKRIVDGAVKHVEGQRRKVVITRGFMHLRLLRALEFQTEFNPNKAKGSIVVASTVVIPDGSSTMGEMLYSKI